MISSWTPSETKYLHRMRKRAGPDDDAQISTHTVIDRIYWISHALVVTNMESKGESDCNALLPVTGFEL